jgi:hypothetical protein
MNTARRYITGAGTQTAAIGAGGYQGTGVNSTESWNGTSWSNLPGLTTARYGAGPAGTQSLALAGGGYPPSNVAVTTTEEWTGEIATAGSKTLTTS